MQLFEIKKVNTTMERHFNQKSKDLGLTGTQASVLHVLYESTDKLICQRDIENALGLTHPTVCSLLSRLQDKGFIEARSVLEDRRYHEIVLTSKGKKYKKKVESVITEMNDTTFRGFTPKELKTLQNYLDRIQQNSRLE